MGIEYNNDIPAGQSMNCGKKKKVQAPATILTRGTSPGVRESAVLCFPEDFRSCPMLNDVRRTLENSRAREYIQQQPR
jgi:hypothetical protein